MPKTKGKFNAALRCAARRPVATATVIECVVYGIALLLACRQTIDGELFMTATSLVLVWTCAHATVTDLVSRKILNRTTYGAAIAILGLATVARFYPEFATRVANVGLLPSILGGAVCGGIFLVPYLAGSGGAGDVKLSCCLGLALGLENGLIALCASFFASFVYGLTRFIVGKIAKSRNAEPAEKVLVPMAPCFFFGALFVLSGLGSAFQYSDLPW